MKRETLDIGNVQDLLEKNDRIIGNIRDMNAQYFSETGKRKAYHTVTYGCQMNEHDSEKLEAMLMDMGYEKAPEKETADLIIFNTCCVRENAELRVYGNLGHIKKLKESNEELILAVCGCMMQQPHIVEEIKKKYKYVDLVFGTHNLYNFPSLLNEVKENKTQVVEVWDSQGDVVEGLPVARKKQLKGFVNIMYGCNNFCTYCIVPYTRGRERSRLPEDIISEIKLMVEMGTKEVMLLGQNVNSYGKTLEKTYDFADLLSDVAKVDGLERIRFMTSHPKDINVKLLEVMASHENICRSLHLPVQSGSNKILKAMNRSYTRESYLEIIKKAKALMPDIGVTTDIIVGFPGETEEDFLDTVDMIKQVHYDSAFTFIYSKRTGTPAATLEGQVDEDVKSKRLQRLLKVLQPMVEEKMKSFEGKVLEVLVESLAKSQEGALMGKSTQGLTVNFLGEPSLIGQTVQVKITRPKKFSLFGEIQ